jgi:hypothetical protein
MEKAARLNDVAGWLSPVDELLFSAIDRVQVNLGATGDLLEIGTYFGRSAIVLGALLHPGESLTVVDPFGKESPRSPFSGERYQWVATLNRQRFEENYLKFHESLPAIIEDFSTNLAPGDLGAGFRLVHVDGAHDFTTVSHDTHLAVAVLGAGGVIAFDDIHNARMPGVAAAVWPSLGEHGLAVLAVSPKLWVCRQDDHGRMSERLRNLLDAAVDLEYLDLSIMGRRVLAVKRVPPPTSIFRRTVRLLTPPIFSRVGRILRLASNEEDTGCTNARE